MTEKFVLPRSCALEFADSIPFIRIDLKFIVSFKNGFYVWRSSGDQNFGWRPPVWAFLAFFLRIWLIPKIVRLETLPFAHENCKQKNDCEKNNKSILLFQQDHQD